MVVSDPRQPDDPIVLANQAFLNMCGYTKEEVLGRNCRFLQGADTSQAALDAVREALAKEHEITVELLNYRRDGSSFWNELFISPVHDDDGKLLYYFASQKDVTVEHHARERKHAELRLSREVDHRAKNVLALVQGIVRMSRADTIEQYAATIQGRVQALARAHTLLSERHWREVPLERLIQTEIEPFGSRRVNLDGPRFGLPSSLVQPIALLIYELVANAVEHGALSTECGRIEVNWKEEREPSQLILWWREEGGPRPPENRRPGFGFSLISGIVERQLQGTKTLEWGPDGLKGHFAIPLHRHRKETF